MIDLTPPEHESTAAIDEAAMWLATTPRAQRTQPVIPELRERFGLCAHDAICAIRQADLIRARAH